MTDLAEKEEERLYKEAKKKVNEYMGSFGEKPIKQLSSSSNNNSRANLTDRFNNAKKDNPKLSYSRIYKEMGVDTKSEDPSVYKDAEDMWLKKHGY